MDNQYYKIYYENNRDKYKQYYKKYCESHLSHCEKCNKSYFNIKIHNSSIKHSS